MKSPTIINIRQDCRFHLDAEFVGKPRTAGATVTRTVRDLLQDASDKEAVWGMLNLPLDETAPICKLLEWHADRVWQQA